MANKKITDLTTPTGGPATGDIIELVDVSDTTDSAAGSSRQTTLSNVMSLAPVQSVAGKTGAVTLAKADVGLGSVDNTADASKTVAAANAVKSATTTVDTSAATAPSAGQVLTATDSTHATWQTPSSGFADPTTTKGDLIVHGASTTRLAVGTDGQVLTADSTQTDGVKWATPSAGGSSKPRVLTSINFTTSHLWGVTGTVGTGSAATAMGDGFHFNTGSTSTGQAYVYDGGVQAYMANLFDLNPQFWFEGYAPGVASGNDWTAYVLFGGTAGQAGNTPPAGQAYFGFKWVCTSGTLTVYGVTSDGTTETATSTGVTNVSGNQSAFVANLTSGTKCEFYINGSLVATNTTHLPTGTPGAGGWGISIKKNSGTSGAEGVVSTLGLSYEAY